jgi:hypothetical protein
MSSLVCRGALALFVVVGLVGCAPPAPRQAECHPTIAQMTPPAEALEFTANGSSTPDAAREQLKTANWYGNDAMWVILPPNGEIVGRLDDKIPPYRLKRGLVQYEARQLDGNGTVQRTPIGPNSYGDIGFAAGGPAFPTMGCWQVTYWLDGASPLTFVIKVRPGTPRPDEEQVIVMALATGGVRGTTVFASKFDWLFGSAAPRSGTFQGTVDGTQVWADVHFLDTPVEGITACVELNPTRETAFTVSVKGRPQVLGGGNATGYIGSAGPMYFAGSDRVFVMTPDARVRDLLRSALALSVPSC